MDPAKFIIDYQEDFQRYFGLKLRDYFTSIFGFDILGFDKYLMDTYPEEYLKEMSCSEFTTKKFGEKSTQLISNLLKYRYG